MTLRAVCLSACKVRMYVECVGSVLGHATHRALGGMTSKFLFGSHPDITSHASVHNAAKKQDISVIFQSTFNKF